MNSAQKASKWILKSVAAWFFAVVVAICVAAVIGSKHALEERDARKEIIIVLDRVASRLDGRLQIKEDLDEIEVNKIIREEVTDWNENDYEFFKGTKESDPLIIYHGEKAGKFVFILQRNGFVRSDLRDKWEELD